MTALLAAPGIMGASAVALLLESALKATLALGAAGLVALALRRGPAAVRHAVWAGALAAALLVPVLAPVAPRWRLALFPAPAPDPAAATAPAPSAANPARLPADLAGLATARAARGPATAAVDAVTPAAEGGRAAPSLALLLLLAWSIGALLVAATVVMGMLWVAHLGRRAAPVRDARLLAAARDAARTLGIGRRVMLLRGAADQMPSTWGIVRPRVLLPAIAEGWTDEQLRAVLLHELVHVRRLDALTELVAQLACAAYWFNPVVWQGARRMREERERACDAAVLRAGADAYEYADQLLRVARECRPARRVIVAALAMARRSHLEGRILAILDGPPARTLTRRGGATLGGLLAAATVSLAALDPVRGDARAPLAPADAPRRSEAAATVADTVRWTFAMRPGQWLEVIGVRGNITALPATGRDVELVAVKTTGDGGRAALDRVKIERGENDAGVKICARYPVAGDLTPCSVRGRGHYDDAGVIVSFIVRVPAGVKLSAHTVMGNVTATGLSDYAWGTSAAGDIVLSTAGTAEASTGAGNITASLGAARWTENMEFETGAGHVVVAVPASLQANVEAVTLDGAVGNDFGLAATTGRDAGRLFGHLGAPGGGALSLRTKHGNIFLRRAATGAVPDARTMDSLAAIGTPGRMPASTGVAMSAEAADSLRSTDGPPPPRPRFDFTRDGELPAVVDSPYRIDAGGATDERVALYLPGGFLRRFTPRALSGARDSAAIVTLASFAVPRWVAYQGGDRDPGVELVGDRSLWALTQVHADGRLFETVIGALRDRDWRTRAYAAWVLGQVGDGRAAEALVAALADEHWRVRMEAATAVGEYRARSALPRLISLVSDEHYQVRAAAVDALASIGDRAALPALRAAAKDAHPIVRDAAETALAALGG